MRCAWAKPQTMRALGDELFVPSLTAALGGVVRQQVAAVLRILRGVEPIGQDLVRQLGLHGLGSGFEIGGRERAGARKDGRNETEGEEDGFHGGNRGDLSTAWGKAGPPDKSAMDGDDAGAGLRRHRGAFLKELLPLGFPRLRTRGPILR